MSHGVQWPFIFIQGRIVGKGVCQRLCQEFDLQIDAELQIHCTHGSRRSAVRCGVLQFVVEIAPQLCIAAYLCRDTDTCQSCGKESHRYRQPHTGFQSQRTHRIGSQFILFFTQIDRIAGCGPVHHFQREYISFCILIPVRHSNRNVHIGINHKFQFHFDINNRQYPEMIVYQQTIIDFYPVPLIFQEF